MLLLHNEISKTFVEHFWRAQASHIQSLGTGTTVKGIRLEDIRGLSFPLAPIPEQKRIANKLDALLMQVDACRNRLDKIPGIIKRFRQAVLNAAYSGGFSMQQEICPEWDEMMVGDVCEWITKGTTPAASEMHEGNGEIPYIKVYNLCFNGCLDFTIKPTFIDKNIHNSKLKRSKVYPGNVLMNIVGPPLGKVSIVPSSHDEWNINQAIAVFRPKKNLYNKFLAYFLLAESNVSKLIRQSKATAGQFNLTLEICREIIIPLPPLLGQYEIVRRVEALFAFADRLEARYTAARAQVENLTPALLARIRAARTAPEKVKKPRARKG